ncbi:MAG: metallophosphoesterase [Rikenellaceae bacterium]|jgi:hypothetical protein|nr:metallophosphoesterase [Rikenellaceae bacterium]
MSAFAKRERYGRRRFLGRLAGIVAAGAVAPSLLSAKGGTKGSKPDEAAPLVDSPPVLQRPTESGIVVTWAVGRMATGYVEYGERSDRLDRTAWGDRHGLKPCHERFLQIRIDGLKPNTRYWYRTVTCSFDYHDAYHFERGEPVYSEVFAFETSGPNRAEGSFSVINDTHNHQPTLKRLTERLALVGADYTVWNGDLVNSFDNADMAVEAVLRPGGAAFAARKPMLFVPGNHDYRGRWARNIPLLLPEWEHPAEEDRPFGRNFVVRSGPLALIGLDTGEDKPDRHPAWASLARFEPWRAAQRDWLERALKSPAVATAPFAVAFCHIPLHWNDPNGNGGDLTTGYASFQRQAANLWGPLLTRHGVQALIAAHNHKFRYDPATSDRSWAQIIGGGYGQTDELTAIHGRAVGDAMEIAVDELNTGTELGRWRFPKRN